MNVFHSDEEYEPSQPIEALCATFAVENHVKREIAQDAMFDDATEIQ